jgi:hypothetical protein
MKIDPNLFNTDPKFENERSVFDAMVEGALMRVTARKAKEKPAPETNIFDDIFGKRSDNEGGE